MDVGHLFRAETLIEHGRHGLAEDEARKALAWAPDDGRAHAVLSICLDEARHEEALRLAKEGARLAPDDAYVYWALAWAHFQRGEAPPTFVAIDEGLRLDPTCIDLHKLRAAALLGLDRFKEALEASERGLSVWPGQIECLNFRAMALDRLNRRDEAWLGFEEALKTDPEDALAHANWGWTLLERGDHPGALERFRESLRRPPDLGRAREGTVEALKSRHLVYRWLLRGRTSVSRMGSYAGPFLTAGLVWAFVLLDDGRWALPHVAPLLVAVMLVIAAAVSIFVLGPTLFNWALLFDAEGRRALSSNDRGKSALVGALAFGAALAWTIWLATRRSDAWVALAVFCVLLGVASPIWGLVREGGIETRGPAAVSWGAWGAGWMWAIGSGFGSRDFDPTLSLFFSAYLAFFCATKHVVFPNGPGP